jgi:hypothetical protein
MAPAAPFAVCTVQATCNAGMLPVGQMQLYILLCQSHMEMPVADPGFLPTLSLPTHRDIKFLAKVQVVTDSSQVVHGGDLFSVLHP